MEKNKAGKDGLDVCVWQGWGWGCNFKIGSQRKPYSAANISVRTERVKEASHAPSLRRVFWALGKGNQEPRP